jgi:hypothetical protein
MRWRSQSGKLFILMIIGMFLILVDGVRLEEDIWIDMEIAVR